MSSVGLVHCLRMRVMNGVNYAGQEYGVHVRTRRDSGFYNMSMYAYRLAASVFVR